MAAFTITPGLNKIIGADGTGGGDAICLLNTDGSNRNAQSGDVVTLLNGTYTFNTSNAIQLASGLLGTTINGLTIQGESRDGVILDITGVTFDAIAGGNASNVTIKDLTITMSGTPSDGMRCMRDNADTAMTGWKFSNIKLDRFVSSAGGSPNIKVFFGRPANPIGVGLRFEDIVTTSNYGGTSVIEIVGTNAELDLKIVRVDNRLHTSSLIYGISLIDTRDARVFNYLGANPSASATFKSGVHLQCSDAAKGLYDCDVMNCQVDGGGANTSPLIYAGQSTSYRLGKRIRFHGNICTNSGSYGMEMEGGIEDSEIISNRVINSVGNGIPIPDSNQNITVADNYIDGVTGSLNTGIACVSGKRHHIVRNIICNCYGAIWAINSSEAVQAPDGVNVLINERNVIRDNIIFNVSAAYRVNTVSMPETSVANKFGPNTIYTPSVSFAQITNGADAGNLTQAQWEAKYPKSIEQSDTLLTDSSPASLKYSVVQALNILAGNMTYPYTKYSEQQAANLLVGNSAGNLNKFGTQHALNFLV